MFLLNAHGVKPLKNKKGKTVVNVFLEIVNESNRKPKKPGVDQGIELYNKLLQEWLDNNEVLMYSTHNEGESVINERFIKTEKAKIYKGKSYLAYLNELMINTRILIIILLIRNLLMLIILLWLKNLRLILKVLNFKLMTA